jgi:DNA-binding NarL/FixJ family response regulator
MGGRVSGRMKPEKTARNRQVIAARAAGWSIRAIAASAHLSPGRVRAIIAMVRRRAERVEIRAEAQLPVPRPELQPAGEQ